MKNKNITRDKLIEKITRLRSQVEERLIPEESKTEEQLKKEARLLRLLLKQLSETEPSRPVVGPEPERKIDSYQRLFEDSPLAFTENDMSKLLQYFTSIRQSGVSDFRQYFEHHPAAVAKCAVLVRRTYANPATLELFGADDVKDFADGLMSVFHEESYRVFREELIALAGGATMFADETVVFTLQGEKKNIYYKVIVVPGYEKTLSRVSVFMVDITDRKQAEDLLEEMREILERARLRELEE